MVKDEKAESLEKACLYHRVASRWLIVLNQCTNQSDKLWVSRRRSLCLRKARQKRKKLLSVLSRFYLKKQTYPRNLLYCNNST
ncbi:TPA: PerC family transcriptional regulator [Salmonella enterica subsp. enterica serovar Oranienburg]